MGTFKASVQYGDWKGTAAADDADFNALDKYLDEKGLKHADEFLIATSLWVGENHPGRLGSISATAYLHRGHRSAESVKASISSSSGPVPVRRVQLELTIQEYIELFKRFDVMLTRRGLDLDGREHTYLD